MPTFFKKLILTKPCISYRRKIIHGRNRSIIGNRTEKKKETMLYLEDYLECIEHMPHDLRDRFTEMRELDLTGRIAFRDTYPPVCLALIG